MTGIVRVGIGGWTFAPWRAGQFYPEGLAQSKELGFASRALATIEINGTSYSTFTPKVWKRWHDETPDGFVFSVKASRYVTNRRSLAEAGPSIEKFVGQGLEQLGPKLGPLNWQFPANKRFDPEDFAAFLRLLPRAAGSLKLRHAVEVRHPSFADDRFLALARDHGLTVVRAFGGGYPELDAPADDLAYVRVMMTTQRYAKGLSPAQVSKVAEAIRPLSKSRDVFVYVIAGEKSRNPAAALALARALAPPGRPKPMR